MSLINDALKRAQEEKDRNTPTPSPAPSEEPAMEVSSAPKPGNRNRLVAVLLVGVLAAAGGWCFLHFKKNTPAAASACSSLKPAIQATTQPTAQATALKIVTTQPAVATRPRVRVVAPPPGGLAVQPPTTQSVPQLQTTLENIAGGGGSDIPRSPLDNLMAPLTGPLGMPGPASGGNGFSTLQRSTESTTAPAIGKTPDKHDDKTPLDKPPVTAAKNTPETQPAVKPERSIATAANVSQQFHVSCIMFSDQGSTAIINGSPVKVGQTIRAEGDAKTGLPEEAVVKKIDRNCVEIELGGEKYLLRI